MSVDDPRTTLLRREIVSGKPLLKSIYSEWYRRIVDVLPRKRDRVVELGSGAGFLQEIFPQVITSDVFEVPGINLIAEACALPFSDGDLDAIVMTDVFHHIPNVAHFLDEATRCIRPGGRIVMLEPWRTRWSQWVYTNLHSEPFDPMADWGIPLSGPLSGANGALPWIVFERDRAIFAERFPQWRIDRIEIMMPLSYLLSGGVSLRSLVPGWLYGPIRAFEDRLGQQRWGMFALIVLDRCR